MKKGKNKPIEQNFSSIHISNNINNSMVYNRNAIINNYNKNIFNDASSLNFTKEKIKKQESIENVKNVMKFTDDEVNLLPYELALIYDKRTFCVYYISLIRTKHNLVFSFFHKNDYNSKITKIDLYSCSFI